MASETALIVHPQYVHTLAQAPSSSNAKTVFEALPCVILHETAALLDARELGALSCVNRRCSLWRKLVLQKFGWEPSNDPVACGYSWKAFYRFQQEFFQNVILSRATDSLMHARMGNLHMPASGGFIPVYV